MTEPHETENSLAEIDRKLRELQAELSRVFEGSESTAAAVPSQAGADPAPPPRVSPPLGSATASPAGWPDRSAVARGGLAPTAMPRTPTAPLPEPSRSPVPPGPPVAPAIDPASQLARLVDETAAQVDDLGRQLTSLRQAHDELQRTVFALQRTCEERAPAIATPAGGGSSRAIDDQPGFQRHVLVNAGPFTDIAALGAFEQSMAAMPHIEDVYVRSYEGNRALLDVRLNAPVQLVDEMSHTIPFAFSVAETGQQLVTIDLEP